jgi:hypothetical protein
LRCLGQPFLIAHIFTIFALKQVEPIQNAGISNSMRDKLMQEASTGMDSESKQNNVILYIIGIVGVLVVLGGQGILY